MNHKTTTAFHINRRQAAMALGALSLGLGWSGAVQANGPVKFILPVSAGSGVDTIARAASNQLGAALGVMNGYPSLANGGSYRLEQGGYAVTDLMAGYEVNKHLDLQVNANNIFDRKYYSAISQSWQYGGDVYGAPRNMMLTAKYSF